MAGLEGDINGSRVTIDSVSKRYGALAVVEQFSLDVRAGEFVSLLGPSGSGKTTLLMTIAGFEQPNSGRILIGERDVTQMPPNKRGLGMVFQRYALFPHMTVAQNIGFPLRVRKLGRQAIAKRVDAALSMVRLDGLGQRLPGQLSGGQQQRVALARALVFEPPVLLMDEPLGALDKKLREQMQIEIKAIQERLGVTVIYVTHDQEEALTMSDRVAVMSAGRLEQVGAPAELYRNPKSAFVADFIGKMNFFTCEFISRERENLVLRVSPHSVMRVPNRLNGATTSLAPHTSLQVAVRPERLRLSSRGGGGPDAVAGKVDATIFAGSHMIYLVSVVGREEFSFHVQLPADGADFQRGQEVDVTFERDGLHVFPVAST